MFKRFRNGNYYFAVIFIFLSHWALAGGAFENGGCLIAGPEDAKLTIEEFADFECSYCAKGAKVMEQVLKEYAGKVKLVFRNRPLDFHAMALPAAKAMSAVCLQDPAKAYTFQSEIFKNQEKFKNEGESYLFEMADKLGINIPKMKDDFNSVKVSELIEQDRKRADELNVKGTPGFKIGSASIMGAYPFEEFKKVIDKQLEE